MNELSINSQWKYFLRHSAEQAKEGTVVELDCGVSVFLTRCAMNFFNEFFLSSNVNGELDLCQRLEQIKLFVTKEQLTFPWLFSIEPELLPIGVRERSKEICLASELDHVMDSICMQTMELLPPVRTLPETVIKFATSQQDAYDALLLNVQAHHMNPSVTQNTLEHCRSLANFEKQLCCIVSVNGEPVSTATIQLLQKCLYVVLVATSAEHRKCGYAEVALRTCTERALKMFPSTKYGIVLHATKEGRPLYAQMGFKEISHVEMYMPKSSEST